MTLLRNIDLAAHQYIECASQIPGTCYKTVKDEQGDPAGLRFIQLKSYSFRKSPEWDVVGRLSVALKALLGHSEGNNVHQKSFLDALLGWDQTAYSNKNLEEAVYTLRTLIAQMQWHKLNERELPAGSKRLCQSVFDDIVIPPKQLQKHARCFEPTEMPIIEADRESEMPTEADRDIDIEVASISSTESDATFAKKVFGTDVPELQNIFKEYGPTIALPKTMSTASSSSAGDQIETKASEDHAAGDKIETVASANHAALANNCNDAHISVSPAAWAKLNKGLKTKQVKSAKQKGKAKATPKAKAKANPKAKAETKVPIKTWKAYLNREHSKVWHAERNYGTSFLGLDDAEAKQRAARKAKVRTDSLKDERKNKKLPDYPPSP